MARKGILSPDLSAAKARTRPAPQGTVGALQSSLTKLQENAVQEIAPELIDDAGVTDRLEEDAAADSQLQDSLQAHGQQVPVLLRPHTKTPGRFEVVYGRRRIRALKALGLPVKAMVRHLDDHGLILAQGQENTARRDLSFIEKATFAAQLDQGGYDRDTIAAALSIDKPMVSRMLKVGSAFELEFLRQIGSAPGIGRERWMTLVDLMQDAKTRSRVFTKIGDPSFQGPSDDRFEQVLAWARATPARKAPAPARARTLRDDMGQALAELRHSAKGLTLTIPSRSAPGFDAWFDTHAETLLNELHARWKEQDRAED